jgi:phosphoglycerate dehydrogenase-like enzyme
LTILVAIYSQVSAWNIPDEHVERLRREFPHHSFLSARTDEEVTRLIARANAAFMAEINRDQFGEAAALRWIHSPAAGVGGMLFPELRNSTVVVSNSRGMSADVIAEHVLAVALALFRKLQLAIRRQSERSWAQDEMFAAPSTRTIAGADVLIVGLGSIGTAVARRCSVLGASVTGIRRHPERATPDGVTRAVPPEALLQQLPQADIVVIAAPHTSATRQMIGARELAAMRQDAVLINVSRGKLLDESALVAALSANRIGGAGLDVFDHEPLDPASPLWSFPNVIITPHTSGFRPDHWDAATDLFAENLRRFDAGEPLLNVVDKTAGY